MCIFGLAHQGERLVSGGGDEAMRRLDRLRQDVWATVTSQTNDPLPAGPLWPGLRYVAEWYSLDPTRLTALVDGRRTELANSSFATFDDLYAYCDQTGASLDLLCLNIWHHDGDPGVAKLAEYRGVALRLTSLLARLRANLDRGWNPLPAEDLERFGCPPEQISSGEVEDSFDRLMVYQVERIESYFQMSQSLERHLDVGGRATCRAAMCMSRKVLKRIARSPRDVLAKPIQLSLWRQLRIVASARWTSNGSGRPSARG